MNIKLLGQGFEADSKHSVGNYLMKFFLKKDFHTFTGISAFTSKTAISGLAKYMELAKSHFETITIITGVDQKVTSKEALEALMKLGINSYVFYTPSPPIFHPKIYLFEGDSKSKLIIGSSNLTQSGLFMNVETSLLINLNNKLEVDKKVVTQLKKYFKSLFDLSDLNLKKISGELIEDLVETGVVPTEAERKAAQIKVKKTERQETTNVLLNIFPKRAVAKIPKEFRNTSKRKAKSKKATTAISNKAPKQFLWASGALTERDLNVPKGERTNQTGSMLFKKGELKDIDQRHYFRDEVFSSLDWVADNAEKIAHLERATALFKLIVMGEDYGVFELNLTHNTKTDTASYRQNNSMTSVSWGDAKKYIARNELIGKSAKLYKVEKKKNEFILEIE